MRNHAVLLLLSAIASAMLLGACSDSQEPAAQAASAAATAQAQPRAPIVAITRERPVVEVPGWDAPRIEVNAGNRAQLRADAEAALAAGELFGEADDAIPLLLALRAQPPTPTPTADGGEGATQDASTGTEGGVGTGQASDGIERALKALIGQGEIALAAIDQDRDSLRRAHAIAAVARVVAGDKPQVVAYLDKVDRADQARAANRRGERALNAGRLGLHGEKDGAVAHFRKALRLRPGDARASQGIAAAESAVIRRAELAAAADDYEAAADWLDAAAGIRKDPATVADARERVARQRVARIGNLRDLGVAALSRGDGLDDARRHLATLLRIAPPRSPAATELREKIELASHYGLFKPGQAFTDALKHGGRGPEMVVIAHGAFRMGAAPDEDDASDAEYPARNIRFDRGLAVSRHEVTVGEFGNFVTAADYVTRAEKRGHSTVYDERSGNLVRRSGVDWRDDYAGRPADADMPVVHVSAMDAMAYARWLSEQTGRTYRLPSEAEFEYALRAGSSTRFPWGEGAPPDNAGNFTGALDESPSGRHWRNAFADYGDDAWGPAAVGSYAPNEWGLHDMAGNVSEWVADCWHDSYRRAPAQAQAWINPGCESRVVRGGSWASSPEQTRSAWRLGADADKTTARVGFRVVREI